jgi:HEXXH motif-containing protein
MSLLDSSRLARLQAEFCLSMKALLAALCQDLDQHYARIAQSMSLPMAYFRYLGQRIEHGHYGQWKVVGWIETLNDLVYFIDLLQQYRVESDRREFNEELLVECQDKFFENSYLDDLFPRGVPQLAGLGRRLQQLCVRLAQEVTQESLFLVPGLPSEWVSKQKQSAWCVKGNLGLNYERAEPEGAIAAGISGDCVEASTASKKRLAESNGRCIFVVEPGGMSILLRNTRETLYVVRNREVVWHWVHRPPIVLSQRTVKAVTVGATLVYGKTRQPRTVARTEQAQVDRMRWAWLTIREAWPEGYKILSLLTSRIIPLKAKGVVSFSYRHRPGLSFINCFDRDDLDLIDDLIHENSHHHLNLLLRKHVLYHGDHNQQIFYSPWRRSLRPLRGILHATFTFTMGAILFERLSAWGARGKGPGLSGKKRSTRSGIELSKAQLLRARFRCLEELESVRYSIQDLHYADQHLGWLTGSGRRLVGQLVEAIIKVERKIAPYRKAVLRSKFGPALRRHVEELRKARQTYGPVRLGKV